MLQRCIFFVDIWREPLGAFDALKQGVVYLLRVGLVLGVVCVLSHQLVRLGLHLALCGLVLLLSLCVGQPLKFGLRLLQNAGINLGAGDVGGVVRHRDAHEAFRSGGLSHLFDHFGHLLREELLHLDRRLRKDVVQLRSVDEDFVDTFIRHALQELLELFRAALVELGSDCCFADLGKGFESGFGFSRRVVVLDSLPHLLQPLLRRGFAHEGGDVVRHVGCRSHAQLGRSLRVVQ